MLMTAIARDYRQADSCAEGGAMVAARVAEQSSRALHAYVPRLAIEWLRRHPDERHLAVDGSLAFVDISGFTKLTERLARVGRAGPEELSDILDSTFGALLTAARTDGADLVKWGGDAVLLLFRGDDHATRAARAAYRMRRVLRDVGHTQASAGQVTLRMSVGIHSGRFHFFLVGDPEIHRELIVSGPGASVTAEMESIASAGQIVVSDATAALLHPASIGLRVPGGWVLRSAPVLADRLDNAFGYRNRHRLIKPDSGVEQRVDDVGGQVHQHHHDPEHQRHPLHDREVALEDGVDHQLADAR